MVVPFSAVLQVCPVRSKGGDVSGGGGSTLRLIAPLQQRRPVPRFDSPAPCEMSGSPLPLAKVKRAPAGTPSKDPETAAARARGGFAKLLETVQHKQKEHNAGPDRAPNRFSMDYLAVTVLSSPDQDRTFADGKKIKDAGFVPQPAGAAGAKVKTRRKAVVFFPDGCAVTLREFIDVLSAAGSAQEEEEGNGMREAQDRKWDISVLQGQKGIDAFVAKHVPTAKSAEANR
ncbi:hypothetical protein T484DRAFT_1864742 [Baffinella frigidus]|nr:hypothetical protein T484DRAFT_1864742 [Cryptophyta sp. CCMP2293]